MRLYLAVLVILLIFSSVPGHALWFKNSNRQGAKFNVKKFSHNWHNKSWDDDDDDDWNRGRRHNNWQKHWKHKKHKNKWKKHCKPHDINGVLVVSGSKHLKKKALNAIRKITKDFDFYEKDGKLIIVVGDPRCTIKPEPNSFILIILGMLGIVGFTWYRRKHLLTT